MVLFLLLAAYKHHTKLTDFNRDSPVTSMIFSKFIKGNLSAPYSILPSDSFIKSYLRA